MQSMWNLKTMSQRLTVLWFQDLATENLEVNFICMDTHYKLPVISNILIHARQFIPALYKTDCQYQVKLEWHHINPALETISASIEH